MNTPEQKLIVAQQDDVLSLTFNTPGKANALAPDVVEELMEVLDNAEGVRLVVLRGNGKHFCAGFDLSDSRAAWTEGPYPHLSQSNGRREKQKP